MAATGIVVVVLEEHGRGQDDVGELRRLGHELLVDHEEQVLARQPLMDVCLIGGDGRGIGVLDEHRLDRRPVLESAFVAAKDRADLGHVERPGRSARQPLSLDQ